MDKSISFITPLALRHRLKHNPDLILLDVRNPKDFRTCHIEGARSAPLNDLKKLPFSGVLSDLEPLHRKMIYIISKTGSQAGEAAELLKRARARNLLIVNGGLSAWEREGLPLNRSFFNFTLERQAQFAIAALLVLKVFFGFTVHELFFVLAAVVGAGLVTAVVTHWHGLTSLMARMPWNKHRHHGRQAEA